MPIVIGVIVGNDSDRVEQLVQSLKLLPALAQVPARLNPPPHEASAPCGVRQRPASSADSPPAASRSG